MMRIIFNNCTNCEKMSSDCNQECVNLRAYCEIMFEKRLISKIETNNGEKWKLTLTGIPLIKEEVLAAITLIKIDHPELACVNPKIIHDDNKSP